MRFNKKAPKNTSGALVFDHIKYSNYLSVKELTPGNSLPSKNSRLAPPPVET